jgi:putative tryptophan/tyrosine transport system substrate-binding protein
MAQPRSEMRRRELMKLLSGIIGLLPHVAGAQQPRRTARVAVLWHAVSAEEEGPYLEAVRLGFRDLGYTEGHTITLEHRFPNEEPERFRSMAAELAALKPDVLLAAGGPASISAKSVTTTIPVVFIVVPDPLGLVDSLARPDANVTGLTNFAVQLCAKRLELLKESVPNLSRVPLLINPNVQITHRYIEESEAAASKLGLTLLRIEARSVDELPRAFETMGKVRAQAVVVNAEGVFFQGKTIVAQLALARRLPTCVFSRETLEAGAFMSYGPDQRAIFRRAAAYADEILTGAKPADLAVEQPSRFEFLINRRTATKLGLTVPASVQQRVDQVIE